MTPREIATKLDEEWLGNERMIGKLVWRRDAGWELDALFACRRWLAEARQVVSEELRKEFLICS